MTQGTCTIEDCEKPLRSSGARWCAMHYHRWYRHGDPLKVANQAEVATSLGRRYKQIHDRQHPLAGKGDVVWEHRAVLYNEIGAGPHACNWCGTAVDWLPKGDPACLHVDHLNNDGADNRPENLVPSCATCNSLRGTQMRCDALRAQGFWSNHDTVANLTNHERSPRVA